MGGHSAKLSSSPKAGRDKPKTQKDIKCAEKVYARLYEKSVTAWFQRIEQEKVRPNVQQLAYLQDIRDRCAIEAVELQALAASPKRKDMSEPYRKCLLGPPGTGKSECLRWTRRFFEEVLGWTHGVQFQMVAPQHTMALLIGGKTVHSWGQVPINASSAQDQGNKKANEDIDELFERTQSLRWLLIDEIEALAAVVFGILHGNLCRAMSSGLSVKMRASSAIYLTVHAC